MPKTLEELEEENLALTEELDIEEKKARIAEAKKRYGNDWQRIIGKTVGGLKGSIHEPPTVLRQK